jgi:hypothetical protein
MDQPVQPRAVRITAAAATVRRVSQEAGITPDDPLHDLVAALAEVTESMSELPEETARQIVRRLAPIEKQILEFTETANQVAKRPLIEMSQIRYEILPAILTAVKWSQALAGALLLAAAFGCGAAYMYWRTPTQPVLNCEKQAAGGLYCGYWAVPPSTPGG